MYALRLVLGALDSGEHADGKRRVSSSSGVVVVFSSGFLDATGSSEQDRLGQDVDDYVVG